MLNIPDRFWWAQRVVGVLLAIACLILAIQSVLLAYDIAQFPGDSPRESAILHDQAEEIWLLAAGFALFAVQGMVLIWASFPAQKRSRCRLLAIGGNQEAMPRASVKVDAGKAPALSSEPLELFRRASAVDRRVKTAGYIIVLLFCAPMAGLLLVLAYVLATTNQAGMSLFERGALELLIAGVAVGLVVILVAVTRYLPSFLGRPYGVTATEDGLWSYPQAGRKRFLRWGEMRLFEVIASTRGRRYRAYKLYSRDAIAAWSNDPPSSLAEMGLTRQEFEERHQALLNLIAARTGLLPRTLDEKLIEA